MSEVDVNGTLSNTSESEHSDLGSKSNSSVSSVEGDLRSDGQEIVSETETFLRSSDGQEETGSETFIESNGTKSSELAETLRSIPIFSDSYSGSALVRFACGLADASARKVTHLFPDEQIERADKFVAEYVNILFSQLPLLKKPTDEIIGTFDSQLAPLVKALQKMIPDESGKTRDIPDDQQQIAQTLRVLHIALTVRDRCVEKMKTTTQLQEANQLLSRATETVNILNQSIFGMVVNLRETVQNPDLAALQTRLQSVTAVIFKDEENLPKAMQARIIELSSAILAATDSIRAYIKLNARNFPDYLQERLKPLLTFFEERYGDVTNEIKNGKGSPLEKSRNVIQLTTNHTLPLLHELQEAIHSFQCYTSTSFHNTTDAVKNQLQTLNVK